MTARAGTDALKRGRRWWPLVVELIVLAPITAVGLYVVAVGLDYEDLSRSPGVRTVMLIPDRVSKVDDPKQTLWSVVGHWTDPQGSTHGGLRTRPYSDIRPTGPVKVLVSPEFPHLAQLANYDPADRIFGGLLALTFGAGAALVARWLLQRRLAPPFSRRRGWLSLQGAVAAALGASPLFVSDLRTGPWPIALPIAVTALAAAYIAIRDRLNQHRSEPAWVADPSLEGPVPVPGPTAAALLNRALLLLLPAGAALIVLIITDIAVGDPSTPTSDVALGIILLNAIVAARPLLAAHRKRRQESEAGYTTDARYWWTHRHLYLLDRDTKHTRITPKR